MCIRDSARKAASESIILLKNDAVQEPLLPLKENCRVALIGDFAVTPRYQGAGSSVVNAINIAVSYTHLDVYKRQGNPCRRSDWRL